MGARLRSSDLPSFKESIQTYSERANFVKKSSSVCMVSIKATFQSVEIGEVDGYLMLTGEIVARKFTR